MINKEFFNTVSNTSLTVIAAVSTLVICVLILISAAEFIHDYTSDTKIICVEHKSYIPDDGDYKGQTIKECIKQVKVLKGDLK